MNSQQRAAPAQRSIPMRSGLCWRCAMTPQQRATWPPRSCPLAEAVADLCPFYVDRKASSS